MSETSSISRIRALAPAPEIKRWPVPNLQVDEDGHFEGYASLFDVPDLGKDVVVRGAFADSLRRRGAGGVKMLWQHDPFQPIGRWLSLTEDDKGLKVRGKLNLHVAKARELQALLRDGAIDGLSIGFRVEKARRAPGQGLRKLEKVDLWEVSIVTFPMLPLARVTAVKRSPVTTRVLQSNLGLRRDARLWTKEKVKRDRFERVQVWSSLSKL